MRILLLFMCSLTLVIDCRGFVQPTSFKKSSHVRGEGMVLQRRSTCTAIQLSNNRDDDRVNVNLIGDVDSFTLTAAGFALIAFNFFVLANMGDAGLAGIIARVMNTFG